MEEQEKQEKQAKYSGDWISCNGLADSVAVTVSKRKGLVMQSIYETRAVVDDCRSQVCGGLTAGLDIWEMAILPMILYNAETWQDISSTTVQELEHLQTKFYKCLFAVGSGCPTPVLYLETGGILMSYRILLKKLLFYHHLATLPEDTLAREVFDEQRRLALPGLVQECQDFLVKFGITDASKYTPYQWKGLVKSKISELNHHDILEEIKHSKKISYEEYVGQKHERKAYLSSLNISDARMKFKLNSRMTPTIQMNFPSDPEFTRQLWTCSGCIDGVDGDRVDGSRDTQEHVIICPGYAGLRENKNFDDDKDLVRYFSQVIKMRQDDI